MGPRFMTTVNDMNDTPELSQREKERERQARPSHVLSPHHRREWSTATDVAVLQTIATMSVVQDERSTPSFMSSRCAVDGANIRYTISAEGFRTQMRRHPGSWTLCAWVALML